MFALRCHRPAEDSIASGLWDDQCKYVLPSLAVCPVVARWQPEKNSVLSLRTADPVHFEAVVKGDLCLIKVMNLWKTPVDKCPLTDSHEQVSEAL